MKAQIVSFDKKFKYQADRLIYNACQGTLRMRLKQSYFFNKGFQTEMAKSSQITS